ncbi:MAG: response regulator transcription factor [Achromobacter sp.]|jgi:two-component system response regulator FixJ|uniref:Response regulator protein TmoT n=2 Tax=Achromobacter insuavis TaxID=1287735 RepID=A0A6J5BEF6_9BURK|nr:MULTISPECIES: response regulator [Achromobacter]MBN9638341.1 response regulator transcription factor [Achromobacter sp.]CAB3702708.1 Response regulator protein TmoT [Achromobacter insuavis]CAB3886417.1 Response regulator protein TmoT [Achromobacter insuavis]CUI96845.1 Transcriptional regulatory protein fixJ [Achromobacter sp. 2789STDY5608633]CUJ12990.1 Transcriptional regulatory protein fixJ [Achromobacter sp. 2789STDY5608621]
MNLPDQSPLVYLVDDDDAVRDALALLLRSVGLRSAGYGDPQQFLAQLAPQTIGCVVLDIRMPGISGLDVLARLAEASDLPVVMLTGHANVDLCRRAFKGGAMEFLQKPVDDDIFLDAVQTAVRGHIASRERLAVTQAAAERLARLSTREHEVFERIVQGLSNKEIAREFDLSPRTVETYRANVFAKLEADSLAQLIRQYATLLD